jgi:hypothetical protein
VAKRTKKGTLRQQEIRCAVHGLDAKVTETGELVLDALLVGPGGARPSARDLLESVAPEIPVQRWVVRKLESLVPAETGRTDPITKYRSHGPSSETAPTESGTDPGTET